MELNMKEIGNLMLLWAMELIHGNYIYIYIYLYIYIYI